MRVSHPPLRAPNALSPSSKRQILSHMENFPTPKLAMVPRVANLLTLVFLVATTWWSSAQRPPVHEASAALGATLGASLAAPRAPQVTNKPSKTTLDNIAQAPRISSTPAISGESIIAVGFTAASLR